MGRVLETVSRLLFTLLKENEIENLALLFNKLLPFLLGHKLYEIDNNEDSRKKDLREKAWEEFKKILDSKTDSSVSHPSAKFFSEHLKEHQLGTRIMNIETAYRLAIGMGLPSLFENGLLFHHTYGVPYIPGESLKGLARAVLLVSIYENEGVRERIGSLSKLEEYLLSEEKKFEKHELTHILDKQKITLIFDESNSPIEKAHRLFRDIFGTTERRGQVIFFDAFPESFNPKEHLEIDIMNVHYWNYYQNKKEPGDWDDPKPIKFLVVKEGVVFSIYVDVAPLSNDFDGQGAVELVRRLLKIGLENFGVGGKKRKGYGWFMEV